jgi:hypothetical protein
MEDTRKEVPNYRGNRFEPGDYKLNMLITNEELKSPDFNNIIKKIKLSASQEIRIKQLRRRELCKIYSKDTRNRQKTKNKPYSNEHIPEQNPKPIMFRNELLTKIKDIEDSMNTIISEFETFKNTLLVTL